MLREGYVSCPPTDEVPAAMAHDGGSKSTTPASWQIVFGATAFTTTILSKPANTTAPARCLLNVLLNIVLNYVWMITVLLPLVSKVFRRRVLTNDMDKCLCWQSQNFVADKGLKRRKSFDGSTTRLLVNSSERRPQQGIFVFMFQPDKDCELRSDVYTNVMKHNDLDRRLNMLERRNPSHIHECGEMSCGNTSKKKPHPTVRFR